MKNLLLIGDSIRMGYDTFVREKLAGRMNVYFPAENCRFAQYTLLWDVLHLNACSAGADGEAAGETIRPENVPQEFVYDKDPLTPPEMYRYMLNRTLTRIRQLFPKAEVIFATSTPVIEEQASWAYRSNAEIEQYNAIAREELVPRGVRINELGAFAAEHCADKHSDWVHYLPEGCDLLAGEIVQYLEKENLI